MTISEHWQIAEAMPNELTTWERMKIFCPTIGIAVNLAVKSANTDWLDDAANEVMPIILKSHLRGLNIPGDMFKVADIITELGFKSKLLSMSILIGVRFNIVIGAGVTISFDGTET